MLRDALVATHPLSRALSVHMLGIFCDENKWLEKPLYCGVGFVYYGFVYIINILFIFLWGGLPYLFAPAKDGSEELGDGQHVPNSGAPRHKASAIPFGKPKWWSPSESRIRGLQKQGAALAQAPSPITSLPKNGGEE